MIKQQQRPLTGRQLDVLECVRDFIRQHGWPPTRAEIAGILQFKSANAAEEHLRAIEAKGFIEIVRGTARGIKLTQPKPKDLFVNPWAQQEKSK